MARIPTAIVVCLMASGVAPFVTVPAAAVPQVVASCDFEGPYSQGDQQIQQHCLNNWAYGRKDMLLPADARVLDAMGNDPRRDNDTAWEVGMQPLFVVSDRLSAERLGSACVEALAAR